MAIIIVIEIRHSPPSALMNIYFYYLQFSTVVKIPTELPLPLLEIRAIKLVAFCALRKSILESNQESRTFILHHLLEQLCRSVNLTLHFLCNICKVI